MIWIKLAIKGSGPAQDYLYVDVHEVCAVVTEQTIGRETVAKVTLKNKEYANVITPNAEALARTIVRLQTGNDLIRTDSGIVEVIR